MNENDRFLVADIIVGYYSRENFGNSELLAERHGAKYLTRGRTLSSLVTNERGGGDGGGGGGGGGGGTTNNLGATTNGLGSCTADAITPGRLSAPSLFGDNYDDDDDDDDEGSRELEPPLPLAVAGGGGKRPGSRPDALEGGIMTPGSLAEQRRERRRERRRAHQDSLRRKEAERESERRRVQAERARRDREVARAVREAEEAERARLLREAREAEDAAPVAARLVRTMQRKAAEAVAAAKAKAAVVGLEGRGGVAVAAEGGGPAQKGAGGVGGGVGGGSGGGGTALMDRHGGGWDRGSAVVHPDRQEDPAAALGILGGGSTEVAGGREEGSHRSVGFDPSAPTEIISVGGEREDGAANHAGHHHPAKKGRRKPKVGVKAERDLPPGGGRGRGSAPADGNESSPALSRARSRALAGASAAESVIDSKDRAGSKSDSSRDDERFGAGASGDEAAPAKPQRSADVSAAGPSQPQSTGGTGERAVLPRRKPSEERAGEPRAVFVHRASIENQSAGAATAAVEAAGASTVTEYVGGGGGARRLSSKGRVGSVLPT